MKYIPSFRYYDFDSAKCGRAYFEMNAKRTNNGAVLLPPAKGDTQQETIIKFNNLFIRAHVMFYYYKSNVFRIIMLCGYFCVVRHAIVYI